MLKRELRVIVAVATAFLDATPAIALAISLALIVVAPEEHLLSAIVVWAPVFMVAPNVTEPEFARFVVETALRIKAARHILVSVVEQVEKATQPEQAFV